MSAMRDLAVRLLISARDQASTVITGVVTTASKAFAALAALVGSLSALFSAGVFAGAATESKDLESQLLKLEATIKATGGAAGYSVAQIDELARSMGDAAEVRDAASQLLTFKTIAGETFERTLKLAKDLAAAGFGTLESATIQLGKALENPAQGISALTEVGVTFTEGQKAMIASLMLTGQQAQAQGLILDAVAGQVGGVAEAMDQGLDGALGNVTDAFIELKQQLGAAVVPVLTEFFNKITDLYGRLKDSGAVTAFGAAIAEAFKQALTWVGGFVEKMDFSTALEQVKRFADGAREQISKFSEAMNSLASGTKTTLAVVGLAWDAGAAVIHLAAGVIAKAMALPAQGFSVLVTAASKVGAVSEETAAAVRNAAESIGSSSDTNFEQARASAAALIDGLKGLATEAPKAADSAGELADATQAIASAAEAAADSQTLEASAAAKQAAAAAEAAQEVKGLQARYRELMTVGDAQGAARILQQINQIKAGLSGAGQQAGVTKEQVAAAFKTLGIQSQADLKLLEARAKEAFDAIKASGTAAPEDVRNAFIKYAETAIAANDGVASSALRANAALLGLQVQAGASGDQVVRANQQIAGANQQIADTNQGIIDTGEGVVEANQQIGQSAASAADIMKHMQDVVASMIGDLREYSGEAADAVQRIVDSYQSWYDKIAAISALDPVDFVGDTELSRLTGELADLETGVASAKSKVAELQDFIQGSSLMWRPWYEGLQAIAEFEQRLAEAAALGKQVEIATTKVAESLDGLKSAYEQGSIGLSDYISRLESLSHQYAILGEDDIPEVIDALADAKAEMASFTDSAKSGLIDLQKEWAGLNDQKLLELDLEQQAQRAEIQLQLLQAKKDKNAEAISYLEQQLGLLDQIYAKRRADEAASEAADKAKAAEDAATEAARRAALTDEARQSEDLIAALQQQLAAAILAQDAALQQSILDQIAAEKERHETYLANLAAEAKAKEKTSATTSTETTSAAANTAARTAAASATTSASGTATTTKATTINNINIAGVLDVNDRATLETLARKLKPIFADLERKGA